MRGDHIGIRLGHPSGWRPQKRKGPAGPPLDKPVGSPCELLLPLPTARPELPQAAGSYCTRSRTVLGSILAPLGPSRGLRLCRRSRPFRNDSPDSCMWYDPWMMRSIMASATVLLSNASCQMFRGNWLVNKTERLPISLSTNSSNASSWAVACYEAGRHVDLLPFALKVSEIRLDAPSLVPQTTRRGDRRGTGSAFYPNYQGVPICGRYLAKADLSSAN